MEILSAKEVSRYLRINEKKVYSLVNDGEIPYLKIGGKIVFIREEIDKWLYERMQGEKDILIAGSDDPLLRFLVDSFNRESSDTFVFYSPSGSMKGLELLKSKRAKISVCHVLDILKGENLTAYSDRFLEGMDCVVVELFKRKQGLITRKGNPLGLKSLRDLTQKGVRIVNRNKGSGTRILFDYLIQKEGIEKSSISGYETELESHLKCGLYVRKGFADCAFGIGFVAHVFDLEFIPLFTERFDMVIPKEFYLRPHVKKFLSVFREPNLIGFAHEFPGYEFDTSGRVINCNS